MTVYITSLVSIFSRGSNNLSMICLFARQTDEGQSCESKEKEPKQTLKVFHKRLYEKKVEKRDRKMRKINGGKCTSKMLRRDQKPCHIL